MTKAREMTRSILAFLAVAAAFCAAASCGSRVEKEGTNTNWGHCTTNADCAMDDPTALCVSGMCHLPGDALVGTTNDSGAPVDASGGTIGLECFSTNDCPSLPLVRCDNGLCVDSDNKIISLWVGAPCEECNLTIQIDKIAGSAATDCGTVAADAGAVGFSCARAAFEAREAFSLVLEGQGIDSQVYTAWVFDGQEVFSLSYDSNVCGGTATCPTQSQYAMAPICGPLLRIATCENATLTSDDATLFTCSSLVESKLCGPYW